MGRLWIPILYEIILSLNFIFSSSFVLLFFFIICTPLVKKSWGLKKYVSFYVYCLKFCNSDLVIINLVSKFKWVVLDKIQWLYFLLLY